MRRAWAVGLSLGALAAGATGCGSGSADEQLRVPADAVAVVDGEQIPVEDYETWRRGMLAFSGEVVEPPKGPGYEDCIERMRETRAGKGADADELREQCVSFDRDLRQRVMSVLITGRWVVGEATEQGIEVSDDDVATEHALIKRQTFPDDAAYRRFLESGVTEEELLERSRVQLLTKRLQEAFGKAEPVTEEDAEAFYREHRDRFAVPERRDVRVVVAKSAAQARAARRALEEGASWDAVAKRYSISKATRGRGGLYEGVVRVQQGPKTGAAVFGAQVGKLVGPVEVEADTGWIVFEVEGVDASTMTPFDEVKARIMRDLHLTREADQREEWHRALRDEWRPLTTCREPYVVGDCVNGPDEPPLATAP
jgi:foldase protein PrsA